MLLKRLILIGLIFIFLNGCAIFDVPYIPYIRGGDCIDRAVEIRKSLREQGYEAEMILGMRGKDAHAWVDYKDKKTGEWVRIENY